MSKYTPAIFRLAIIIPLLLFVIFSLSFQSVFAGYGYGYGYGYGDCTVPAPQNLTVQKNIPQRTIQLQWTAVNFSSCHTALKRYHVQLDKGTTTVREYVTTSPQLLLKNTDLPGAGAYRYRVNAEDTHGYTTAWSSYKSFVF